MKTNTIHCGNCVQVMPDHLPDNSIDLTVTSPPYDVMDKDYNLIPTLRDYNGYALNFADLAGQLWRVTKEGGVVVWVVGDATVDGSETCTPELQKLYFKGLGFRVHDTMIYGKDNPQPLNPSKKYNPNFEFMFIFSKGEPKTINLIKIPTIQAGKIARGRMRNNGSDKLQMKTAGDRPVKKEKIKDNIWLFHVGGDSQYEHPAKFPEALARDHIISWSNPGDVVLDPMCGSGTTLKMAKELGRQWIGIDISQEYVDLSWRRVDGAKVPFVEMLGKPKAQPEPKQLKLGGSV